MISLTMMEKSEEINYGKYSVITLVVVVSYF